MRSSKLKSVEFLHEIMDGKIVQDFSQLRFLPMNHANRTHSSSNRRSLVVELQSQDEQNAEAEATTRMDALVQDLSLIHI